MKNEWTKSVVHVVHEHDYSDTYDIPQCYELQFPVVESSSHVLEDAFGESIAGYLGKDSGAVLRKLRNLAEQMPKKYGKCFNRLLDVFSPYSLLCYEKSWWVWCRSDETTERHPASLLFSPSRMIQHEFSSFEFGMRERLPYDSGYFCATEDNENSLATDPYWKNARVLFTSVNGDQILEDELGCCKWFSLAECRLIQCGLTHFELLEFFCGYVLDYGWREMKMELKQRLFPFDSYSFRSTISQIDQ